MPSEKEKRETMRETHKKNRPKVKVAEVGPVSYENKNAN